MKLRGTVRGRLCMGCLLLLALVLGAVAPVLAQTARKPSHYEYRPGSDAAAQPAVGPDYMSRIDGREQFMQLALSHNFLQRPPRFHQRRVLRFGSDSAPRRADGSVPISVWRQVD